MEVWRHNALDLSPSILSQRTWVTYLILLLWQQPLFFQQQEQEREREKKNYFEITFWKKSPFFLLFQLSRFHFRIKIQLKTTLNAKKSGETHYSLLPGMGSLQFFFLLRLMRQRRKFLSLIWLGPRCQDGWSFEQRQCYKTFLAVIYKFSQKARAKCASLR